VARATVSGDLVRAQDVAANALSPELADLVLYDAPERGHQRRVSAASIQRRFVEVGARDVPRVTGADEIVIRRHGSQLPRDEMRQRLDQALNRIPLPAGAIDQRWEILHCPDFDDPGGAVVLTILAPGPEVGRGTLRIMVGGQRAFVSARRSLRAVGLRLNAPARRDADLSLTSTRADTLWVDRLVDWQRLRPASEARAGWSFARSLGAGALICRADLRPSYLVRKGQMVEWKVQRGDLEIRSTVTARSDGALGDWVLVQSPFRHRLRRVCVVGPATVASTAPSPGPPPSNPIQPPTGVRP